MPYDYHEPTKEIITYHNEEMSIRVRELLNHSYFTYRYKVSFVMRDGSEKGYQYFDSTKEFHHRKRFLSANEQKALLFAVNFVED